MKKTKILNLLYWISVILPMGIVSFFLPLMEDQVPVHYDFQGNITRYGSKWEYFFIGICLSLIIIIYYFIELYFQKKEKEFDNQKELIIVFTVVGFIFSTMIFTFCFKVVPDLKLRHLFPLEKLMSYLLSISLIILGYTFKSVKLNQVFGIRTPWTLKSETVWKKTHFLGYKVFTIFGIIGIVVTSLYSKTIALIIILSLLFISIIFFMIYSKYLYDEENKQHKL